MCDSRCERYFRHQSLSEWVFPALSVYFISSDLVSCPHLRNPATSSSGLLFSHPAAAPLNLSQTLQPSPLWGSASLRHTSLNLTAPAFSAGQRLVGGVPS